MHIGDVLLALGGAFLAAGVLARLGAKIGLIREVVGPISGWNEPE